MYNVVVTEKRRRIKSANFGSTFLQTRLSFQLLDVHCANPSEKRKLIVSFISVKEFAEKKKSKFNLLRGHGCVYFSSSEIHTYIHTYRKIIDISC